MRKAKNKVKNYSLNYFNVTPTNAGFHGVASAFDEMDHGIRRGDN